METFAITNHHNKKFPNVPLQSRNLQNLGRVFKNLQSLSDLLHLEKFFFCLMINLLVSENLRVAFSDLHKNGSGRFIVAKVNGEGDTPNFSSFYF